MAVTELTEDDFEDTVGNGAWVVDFWASWCGPCKKMKPIFRELADEMDAPEFGALNIEENQSVATQYGIRSIPAFLYIVDGEVQDRKMGAMSKEEFRDWLAEK